MMTVMIVLMTKMVMMVMMVMTVMRMMMVMMVIIWRYLSCKECCLVLRWDETILLKSLEWQKTKTSQGCLEIVSKYQLRSWWQCWCWFWSSTRSLWRWRWWPGAIINCWSCCWVDDALQPRPRQPYLGCLIQVVTTSFLYKVALQLLLLLS